MLERVRISPELRALIPGFPEVESEGRNYMTLRLSTETSGWWRANEGRLNIVTVSSPLQAVELLLRLDEFMGDRIEPKIDRPRLLELRKHWGH